MEGYAFQFPLRRHIPMCVGRLSEDPVLRAKEIEESNAARAAYEESCKGAVLQGITDLAYVLQEYDESEPVMRIMWKGLDLGIITLSGLKRFVARLENPELLKAQEK